MKIFFDNCVSPTLAATINGFLAVTRDAAYHIKELPCGRHASDVAWMSYLKATGDDWLVITGDLRIHRNGAERQAFRQANLKGLALAPAYQSFPVHQQASFLLWRWSDVEDIVRQISPPFLFELPAHKSSKIRALPL